MVRLPSIIILSLLPLLGLLRIVFDSGLGVDRLPLGALSLTILLGPLLGTVLVSGLRVLMLGWLLLGILLVAILPGLLLNMPGPLRNLGALGVDLNERDGLNEGDLAPEPPNRWAVLPDMALDTCLLPLLLGADLGDALPLLPANTGSVNNIEMINKIVIFAFILFLLSKKVLIKRLIN